MLAGMLARIVVTLLGVLGLTGAAAQQPQPATTLASLQQQLSECISQPKYSSAFWGVKVVSLDTGKTLFEHNAHKLFSPASNSKLYTVALALDRLGTDYRIKTSLYAASKPSTNGILQGDLVVFGRGDPTLNLRLHGSNIFNALQPFVLALKAAGVKEIKGNLVGDCSFIRGPEFGSGWAWDDMEYYYGAEISALTINDNILQLTVSAGQSLGSPCTVRVNPATEYLLVSNRTQTASSDSKPKISFYRPLDQNVVYITGTMPSGTNTVAEEVTMHNPAGLFVALLKEALARAGIAVNGAIRTVNWLDRQGHPLDCASMVELGSSESPPISILAREIQKPSQNLYTDLLLAHIGETSRTDADPMEKTSEDLGIRELSVFATKIGIPKGELIFEEGSGLSRDNLVTPNATVIVLKYMHGHKHSAPFIEALPIAGVDGSLRRRMKDTPAAGNVRAKTGSLRWASSLSGYVTSAAGEHLVFSFMLNRFNPAPNESSRADLDAMAVLLAGFRGRSE